MRRMAITDSDGKRTDRNKTYKVRERERQESHKRTERIGWQEVREVRRRKNSPVFTEINFLLQSQVDFLSKERERTFHSKLNT